MSTPAPFSLLHEFPQRYDALVRFLRRKTGSSDEAREIAHDTWLRLAERAQADAAGAEMAEDARAYLCTVAAHIGLDRQRRAQWMSHYVQGSQATQAPASHAPDVAEGLMYRQAVMAVEAVLAALPDRARNVFVAHRIHGEPQAQIAERLGVSLNTVERDLMHAADRMEAALLHWRGDAAGRSAESAATSALPSALASSHTAPRPSPRRKSLAALLAGVSMFTTGTVLWRHWRDEALRWSSAFATPRARRLVQPLRDGSTLTLDAQSRVRLDWDAHHRVTHLLEGAAFFAVQPDATRPFVVHAAGVTATVLGTRFGVELEPDGAVRVQVEEGRVQVDTGPGAQPVVLRAGQGVRVGTRGTVQPTAGPVADWRAGRLHFEAAPLAQVAQTLSRYTAQDVRADPRVQALRISGMVQVADMGDWLRALPATLPVRTVREEGGGVWIAPR